MGLVCQSLSIVSHFIPDMESYSITVFLYTPNRSSIYIFIYIICYTVVFQIWNFCGTGVLDIVIHWDFCGTPMLDILIHPPVRVICGTPMLVIDSQGWIQPCQRLSSLSHMATMRDIVTHATIYHGVWDCRVPC